MRRRVALVLVVAVTLSLCMPFSAFASTGSGFWNGIGGFFSDLLSGIGSFIANGIQAILDGLIKLFVPSPNYFNNAFKDIQTKFSAKFGGIIETANYLSNAFKNLKAYRDSSSLLTFTFPKGYIFGGKSVNLLSGGEGILNMIRGALSGSLILYTVAFIYKKVTQMINA